jgi:cytochrome P450 family 135
VALPPGPTLPAPLQTLRLMVRPVALMERCRREYGGTFTLRVIPVGEMVFISDPPSLKALFGADRINTIAQGRNIILAPLLGRHSLLVQEGDVHMNRRRLMLPPFHGERMRAYERVMEQAAEAEVDAWPEGVPFRLHASMQAITLDVIMRAVFGVTETRREALRQALLDILAAVRSPATIGVTIPYLRGLPRFRRVQAQIERADDLLASEIDEHRRDPDVGEREDILSMLIEARDEDDEGMSDAELRDQLMTLLLAGHETTATGLAWAFDLMFRRPDSLARAREEAEAGDGTDYIDAVVGEALRLRPVVPFVGRELRQPMTLGGNDLPSGTAAFPSIYLAHTDAETFPDPYAFKPERFLDGGPETYSWIPFGGGTRRCIGAAFAQLEMRVVLRTILRRTVLEPASTEPQPMVRRNVTLSPRDGTPAVLVSREPRRAPVTA